MTSSDRTHIGRRRCITRAAAAGGLGTVALAGCLSDDDDDNGDTDDDGDGDDSDDADDGGDTDDGDDGDDGNGDLEDVEVLHGWTEGDGADAIAALIEAFEEEYPDTPHDVQAIGGEGNVSLDQTVAQRLRDGDPPGIFAGWPGPNLVQYEGALGDVEDIWEEEGFFDAHQEEVIEACEGPDGYSAVPIGSHRMNDLFYNVSVLEDAGVDPEGIDDIDAFVDALDTIGSETDATPYVNGLAPWIVLQFWAVNMIGGQGVDAYTSFIEGEGDADAVQAAFEDAQMILEDYLNADAPEIGFTEANQRLMAGDAAFIHQGNWVAGAYVSQELEFGEDWDRIQYPGTEGIYGLHFDSFIYPADNPSPDAAENWLRFAGTEQAHIAFNQWKASIPTLETATDEFDPYLVETIEDFQEAEARPPTIAHGLAVTQDVQSDLEDAIADYFSDPYDAETVTDEFMNRV